jgi:hypothetical protein
MSIVVVDKALDQLGNVISHLKHAEVMSGFLQ